nr:PREDICTED: condensin-2 complex subunit D3 isoform X1 [Lepisosteus oculatus]
MDLLDSLQLLRIKEIASEWVDTVWESDFTETDPLDARIEGEVAEYGPDAFRNVYKCLLPFATEHKEVTESVWTLFAENGVPANALVALLSHFVQVAQGRSASVPQRECALQAAALYFLLLEIPGSVANKLFHAVLFDKCLDTVKKSWPQALDSGRKRKKDTAKGSQGDLKGRKRPKPPRSEEAEMEDELEEEEEEEEEVYMSGNDLLRIRESVFCLVKNFFRLLEKFPLKDKPQSVQHCMQIFVDLTGFEPVIGEVMFSETPDVHKMKTLPELAYHGLRLLYSPSHGDRIQTVRRIFHKLLYVILMMSVREGSRPSLLTPTQHVVGARDLAIRFVSHIADELKDAVLPVFRILLQHICAKVADKTDYRTHGAQALVKLLDKMPCAEYASFIEWLYKYSCNKKTQYRVFALDVAMALMERPERAPLSSLPPEQAAFLQHKFLVQVMVFGRCSDKAPTVRSRALSGLAQCLQLQVPSALEGIQELLLSSATRTVLDVNQTNKVDSSEGTRNISETNTHRTAGIFKTIEITNEEDRTIFHSNETIAMLRQRASDENTTVRKSSLQVLMNLLKYKVVPCSPEDLSILQDHCRDPAVSVRKQALQCLTDLLTAQPENNLVQKAWLTGVVPVVLDTESSIQEKALDCLEQTIFRHIKNYSCFSDADCGQRLAWDLLTHLCGESEDLCRYINKAFSAWAKQDKFSSAFINNLISHTNTEHSTAAWLLLSKVAGSATKLNCGKILDAWDNIVSNQAMANSTTCHVLRVIGHIAKHLNEDTKERLIDDIMKWLKSFLAPLMVISACVNTLNSLAQRESVVDTQRVLNQYCGEVVSLCDAYLSKIILSERDQDMDEDRMVKYVFTLGEAALRCPAKIEKRIFLLVQSILATNVSLDTAEGSGELPASQPLSQFKASAMPTAVRAHAFITLGKLCLQHEDLAKKCVPALARELEVSKEVPIRNNVIMVMCDLCVRYTTMVDRYIPKIAACLKDREPLIRKQTLIMLTHLLQEDFVKWKESLFFRFVVVYVDPDPSIASLCEFCLVHLLLKRNPTIFSQNFIECIFHFVGYEKHDKYNKFPQTAREKEVFSLKGAQNKQKRLKIYKFLLDHFTDEQRFSITTKISQNVLAGFVDGLVPLDSDACELLSDTFAVLSLKEMKLSALRSQPEEEVPADDEMAMAHAVMQVAQKKLISHVQKKNFIENVIPIITSLKNLLEEMRIPVLKDLMAYLREMMQDYRSEVKELFAMDKQLAAELEYDMKKYEEQMEREGELEEASDAQEDLRPSPHLSPAPTAATGAQPVQARVLPHNTAAVTASPQATCPATPVFMSPRALGAITGRPRAMSLSTAAVLNSARKAAESMRDQRRKTASSLSSASDGVSTPRGRTASFENCDQPPGSSSSAFVNRAISTPEQTIHNVTFGAGVSYISRSLKSSESELSYSLEKEKDVLCLMSPDKQAPPPRQWKVDSPVNRRSIRILEKKTPLKPKN